MVSKKEITKERRRYLLAKANELADAMKRMTDVFPIVSVSEQKYGICIACEEDVGLEIPIRVSLYTHINWDVSDEYLNMVINSYKE